MGALLVLPAVVQTSKVIFHRAVLMLQVFLLLRALCLGHPPTETLVGILALAGGSLDRLRTPRLGIKPRSTSMLNSAMAPERILVLRLTRGGIAHEVGIPLA